MWVLSASNSCGSEALIGLGVEAYEINYHENSWIDLRLKLEDALRGHREDTAGGGMMGA